MDILHSVAVNNQDPAADAVLRHDLGVNALSVILINLRPLNETSTLTNFQRYMGLAGSVNRCTLMHNGVSIISMSGRDIAALNYHRHGIVPGQAGILDTDNERRSCVLPIIVGRHAYDPESAFPPSRRGELQLELDVDIADTGYDDLQYTVELIELLGAKPKEFERKIQHLQTLVAGDNDIDLPLGNYLRGLLCFGTTAWTGASPAPTLGRMATFKDNSQIGYSSIDFETAAMLSQLQGRQGNILGHTHRVNAASTSSTLESSLISELSPDGLENYAWLDFDPTRDDLFALDLRSASRFHLRCNAESADAARVVPIERIKL